MACQIDRGPIVVDTVSRPLSSIVRRLARAWRKNDINRTSMVATVIIGISCNGHFGDAVTIEIPDIGDVLAKLIPWVQLADEARGVVVDFEVAVDRPVGIQRK